MPVPLRPQLRPTEMISVGPKEEMLVALRDPEEFGETVVLTCGAAMVAMLMDGKRTLMEIQSAFKAQTGVQAALNDLESILRRLDEAYLLAGERFDRRRREQVDAFMANPIRPAFHAGGAYESDPQKLREQLEGFFAGEGGAGAVDPDAVSNDRRLCGIVSPHIDLNRGGPTYTWAYRRLAEHCDAELFVIFGTAHYPMQELFCVLRKDFDTPLGVVRTDGQFIDRLAGHLSSSTAGQQLDIFRDELAHRLEHSIEFQAVLLQYLFGGKREFRIVPILAGSFHDFFSGNITPDESPQLQAFIAAVRAAADEDASTVCHISAADFAHIGRHFGDKPLLDKSRLAAQEEDDRKLLATACRSDSAGFFSHVAGQHDRNRICGLSPTYTMLQVIGPTRGELLKYDQAVEPDRTSCVSFASIAFYRD